AGRPNRGGHEGQCAHPYHGGLPRGGCIIPRKAQAGVEREMNSNHPQAVNETRLRVRYAETDQMGVVYHSNHFIWFEVGRVELLRQLGFSYRDMESKDGRF